MSKDILQSIIKNFELQRFKRFLSEKNKKFRPSEDSLDYHCDDNFSSGEKLGDLSLNDGNLLFCVFEVKKELSERSGKKAQYNLGRSILKDSNFQQFNAGIFIFYDQKENFRFSLIYDTPKGIHRDWSTFRRFTYFVNKEFFNKTFLQRIGDADFSSLAKIKEAFSVEPVSNKFFEEFRTCFNRTKNKLEKTNKNTVCLWLKNRYSEEEYIEQLNKFTFSFLGRIIFIYFLQRKGWIENDGNYLRKHIENKDNILLYSNFFLPLFFEVFAKKESERPKEIKQKYKDTPYLNGGLFEKSDLENQLEKNNIFILFDDNFIRDIVLNFFENYNFTIDENSPEDQEVSIDPEMLGKVFENTLAEEERGKKGTFYTPREIVHFMVKDSLYRFLVNETPLISEEIHSFIFGTEPVDKIGFTKDELRLIDNKLENIKVIDPAVGSAAFPVEMMQVLVNLRKQLSVSVGKNINEITLKKKFIKNNLYGVDIDSGAIEIAKLRLWLSLVVDYEKTEAEPLPNLDFQFRLGNSLQEKIDDIDIFSESLVSQQGLFQTESEYEKMKSEMIAIKDLFYEANNEAEKRKLKKRFDELEHKLIQKVLEKYHKEYEEQLKNKHFVRFANQTVLTISKIEKLEQKIKDGTYKLFKPDFHFSEVFDRKDENGAKINGFDIVIGNPPYGVRVEADIKEWHELGSKDSYGVFISTAIKRFLKPGGVLSYIVSDTWLTIKAHKQLRDQVLEKQIHKVIRIHQDCFEATVNACIFSLTNSPDNNGKIIVADLTNISTRKEVEKMRSKLYHLTDFIGQSTPKFAVYEYNQDLIKTNFYLPVFIGNPKLFTLMNDMSSKIIQNEVGEKTPKKEKVRQININGKLVSLLRLGEISSDFGGIKAYEGIFDDLMRTQEKGRYKKMDFSLLNNKLTDDEKKYGIDDKKINNYVNIMKFGDHIYQDIILNYFDFIDHYFPWNKTLIKRLEKINSLRNREKYFSEGIFFSDAGQYAPCFRFAKYDLFDIHAHLLVFDFDIDYYSMLAVLSSKMFKFILKNYINHSVDSTSDSFGGAIIPVDYINSKTHKIVDAIIKKQSKNRYYDYINEQKEIDRLVYDMYGLNKDDIREVETWYARRYPKLARFCNNCFEKLAEN